MQVPLLDLKGQYAPLRAEIETAIRQICDEQRFILGPASRRARGAGRRVFADEARARLVVGHRCAAARADGARRRRRRRGHHDAVHVLRDGRRRRTSRCAAVLLRHRPRHVQPRSPLRCAPRSRSAASCAATGSSIARRAESIKALLPVHLYGQMVDLDAFMASRAQVPARRRRGCRAGDRRRAGGRQARRQRRRRRLLVVFPDEESRRVRRRRHVRQQRQRAARAHAHPARARRRAEVLPLADRRQFSARRAASGGARDQAEAPRRLDARAAGQRGSLRRAVPRGGSRRAQCRCRCACRASATSSTST